MIWPLLDIDMNPADQLKNTYSILQGEKWLPTPLLLSSIGSRLNAEIWLKREDCSPIRSFKLRGGLTAMSSNKYKLKGSPVYVASAGNYGLAIAEAGRRFTVDVTVFVPLEANPSKVRCILETGAKVVHHGRDFDAAKEHAKMAAKNDSAAFWEDGVVEEMSYGAATIADELIKTGIQWDVVLVPIGNGSLIKGIASVFQETSPRTRIIGLVSSGAPVMQKAILGHAFDATEATSTEADGLDVRVPIMQICEEIRALIDDIWVIPESMLIPAVKTLIEFDQVMAEPSAAITIAGCIDNQNSITGKRVAAIITGSHLKSSLLDKIASCQTLLP